MRYKKIYFWVNKKQGYFSNEGFFWFTGKKNSVYFCNFFSVINALFDRLECGKRYFFNYSGLKMFWF